MRLSRIPLSIGLLALYGCTAPAASAAVLYTITVDTSSQFGNAGYIDLQFNPSLPSQTGDADVEGFLTDGILNPSDPGNGAFGDVSGQLPGTLSFDNGTSFNDYTEAIVFGDTITFQLLLSGPAISSPNGDGGGTFTLDFLNGDQSAQLFTASATDVPVFTVNINTNGTTSAETFASQGGGSVVTYSGPNGDVPEPSTIPLAGIGILGLAALRLRLARACNSRRGASA